MNDVFTAEQLSDLRKPLDQKLISSRKGSGKKLQYIEGHVAIDQANRIFGHGRWGYETLCCEQHILLDPTTGEPVGVAYKAKVRLHVQGCEPVADVGSQPVAAWNVTDVVMGRRKEGDNREIEEWEKVAARRTIAEAHEQAEKGAVTDAMKRCLRTYGEQFANGLYGDGSKTQAPKMATEEQRKRIKAYADTLGYEDPGELTQEDADQLLREWFAEYNDRKAS
jgi:DNA repair and recombination protein RAD52